MASHGDDGHHSHGGSGGLGWDLLDSIMLGCFVVVASIGAELLYRTWRASRAGVRYDLTPAGLAATTRYDGPLVDLDKLREAVDREKAEREQEG